MAPSSKKLLIADPKPKPGPPATPPNSASSSSTTDKRTREQPNLSDCHCCNRRINHTNPKDRLQPLFSAWRIVLLCRKCRKSVRSGQTCPYCFKQAANSGDLVQCKVCGSRIHESCVRDFGNCRPWCYLGVELGEFGVCVDCWVPDSLKGSIRVCKSSESKGVLKDDSLEKLRKDAKKVKLAAANAKEQELRKFVVKKNKGALVNHTLDLVAEKDKDEQKGEDSNRNGAVDGVDDAELAIQLHRAINSSPRISRSNCSLNSDDLSVMRIRNWSGLSYKRSGLGRDRANGQKNGPCANSVVNEITNLIGENGSSSDVIGLELRPLIYRRDKKRKIWHLSDENTVVSRSSTIQPEELEIKSNSDDARTSCSTDVSEALIFVGVNESVPHSDIDRYISEALSCVDSQTVSCVNVDRFGQNPVIYQRTRFRQKACQVSSLVGATVEYSSCNNHRVACKPEYRQQDDAKLNRYYLKYGKRVSGAKSYLSQLHSETCLGENQALTPALQNSVTGNFVRRGGDVMPNESRNTELGRYCIKYVKRVKDLKSGSDIETKPHSDALHNKLEACAPVLTVNCSAESGSVSDTKLDSFTNDLPK